MQDGGVCAKTVTSKLTAQIKRECPWGFHDGDGGKCVKEVAAEQYVDYLTSCHEVSASECVSEWVTYL
jgi:hypothetical protein